jgi:FkbH-like protein
LAECSLSFRHCCPVHISYGNIFIQQTMLKYQTDRLDYFKLIKEAKKLSKSHSSMAIRVAILADCAPQQLTAIFKVMAAKSALEIETYEAPYDAIELEVYDSSSGLYGFKPDYVVLLNSTQRLRARFQNTFTDDVNEKVELELNKITVLWETIHKNCPAVILQSTFVLPFERTFGNYDCKIPGTLTQFTKDLNQGIVLRARAHNFVLINDVDYLAGYVGRKNWFDEKLWVLAKTPCTLDCLPLLAQNIIDIVTASSGRVTKCVVMDLDNTIWGGVIGDDGIEGIVLGDLEEGEVFVALQRFLLTLKQRGIVLAVCSRNEFQNAVLPFRHHAQMILKESDIAVFVANWGNKADNIRHIQEALNIGLESMVFLDDSAFERNLVRECLPEVIVPELPDDPALYLRTICELNLFEASAFTETDRKRVELYKVEAAREQFRTSFSNIEEYLRSLDMKIKLERFNEFNLPRIAQLIQRSNQFNLMTRRYSESDCERFMNDEAGFFPFSVTLKDKFGDYGLISVVNLKLGRGEMQIDEYLMSCRVIQRGVENFVMNRIFSFARNKGVSRVTARYIRTKKNAMVSEFFGQFGFTKTVTDTDGNSDWECDVETYEMKPVFMDIFQ